MSKTWAWHSPEDRITSQASTFPQAMGIPDSIPTRTALGATAVAVVLVLMLRMSRSTRYPTSA
jgi:hypothetical protein